MTRALAPHEHFFLMDGRRIPDLPSLLEALENMSEQTFRHHVNEHKNDFSAWIRDCFGLHILAADIQHFTHKDAIISRLQAELTGAVHETQQAPKHHYPEYYPVQNHMQDLRPIFDQAMHEIAKNHPQLLSNHEGERLVRIIFESSTRHELACSQQELHALLTQLLLTSLRALGGDGTITVRAIDHGHVTRIEFIDNGQLLSREEIRNIVRHGHFPAHTRGHDLMQAQRLAKQCGGTLLPRLDTARRLVITSVTLPKQISRAGHTQ